MKDVAKNKDNVVSLFATHSKKVSSDKESFRMEESFEDVMKHNQNTKERLRKERNQANKSVIRSYRLK